MSFGPVELRFVQDVVVDQRQRHAGEVVALEHRVASALIASGYATPILAERLPELRPVRGCFKR